METFTFCSVIEIPLLAVREKSNQVFELVPLDIRATEVLNWSPDSPIGYVPGLAMICCEPPPDRRPRATSRLHGCSSVQSAPVPSGDT